MLESKRNAKLIYHISTLGFSFHSPSTVRTTEEVFCLFVWFSINWLKHQEILFKKKNRLIEKMEPSLGFQSDEVYPRGKDLRDERQDSTASLCPHTFWCVGLRECVRELLSEFG